MLNATATSAPATTATNSAPVSTATPTASAPPVAPPNKKALRKARQAAAASAPKGKATKAPSKAQGGKGKLKPASYTRNLTLQPGTQIVPLCSNPKRPGSRAHGHFAAYGKGTTYAKFIVACGGRPMALTNVQWDLAHGFIKLVQPAKGGAPKPVAKAPAASTPATAAVAKVA